MNTNQHFSKIYDLLGKVEYEIDQQNYELARTFVTEANAHVLEVLDHVVKLEALHADVELSDEKG